MAKRKETQGIRSVSDECEDGMSGNFVGEVQDESPCVVGWKEEELAGMQRAEKVINDIINFASGDSTYFPGGIKIKKDKFEILGDVLYVREEGINGEEVNYRLVLPRALEKLHSSTLCGS